MTANTKKTKRAWAIITLAVFATIVVAALLSGATAPKSSDSKQYDLKCLTELRKEPLKECRKETN